MRTASRCRGTELLAYLVGSVLAASAAPARAVLFDFSDQVAGLPPNPNLLCGVTFVDGPYRIFDRDAGGAENLAVQRPSADIADSDPLVIRFGAPADSVSMLVGHAGAAGDAATARLEAFNGLGVLVAASGDVPIGGLVATTTTTLSVSTPSAVIREVRLLTFGPSVPFQRPEHATESIDDLDVDATLPPCDPDLAPPTSVVLYPLGNFVIGDAVAIVARGTDDRALGSFSYRVDHADGSSVEFPSALQPGGVEDFTSGVVIPGPIPSGVPNYPGVLENGENQVRAIVCDMAVPTPNCTTSAPALVSATIPPDTLNVWARALEVTQAAQDEITVSPFRRYSGYADAYPGVPLIADKTTAARVYIGLEGATSSFFVNVVLYASRVLPGGGLVSLGRTDPVGITVAPGQALDPNQLNQGAIVVLPPGWDDAGEIELTAQVNPPNFFVGQAAPGVPTCGECPPPVPECEDDPSDPESRCNDDANSLRVTEVVFRDPPRPGLRVIPVPLSAAAFGSPSAVGLLPVPQAYLQATYPLPDDPSLAIPGLQVDPQQPTLIVTSTTCTGFLRAVRRGVSIGSLGIPPGQTFTVLGTVFPGIVPADPGFGGCGGMAGRPGRNAWASQGQRSATAHEIGHNRGFQHASSAHGEAAGGGFEEWPHPHGSLGYAGFDPTQVGTARVIPAATATGGEVGGHELMSYGGTPWISARNYVRLLDRLHDISASLPPDRYCDVPGALAACAAPDESTPCPVCYADENCEAQFGAGTGCVDAFGSVAAAAPASPGGSAAAAPSTGTFLVVTGEIGALGATLDPVYAVPLSDVPAPAGEGTHRLEVRDRSGALVAKQYFDATPVEAQGAGGFDRLGFEQAIPLPAEVGKVELFEGTALLATAAASASAPQVHVLAPNGGETWNLAAPVQQIRWLAGDLDADALRFSVFLSRDAGVTWSPLAVDVEGSELLVPTSRIGGTHRALVRVAVSDGVLSSLDQSDSVFAIDSKPMWVEILRPADGGVHAEAEPLRPRGQAQSFEAGPEPNPGAGELLRFRATPRFGGPIVSAIGAAPQMQLAPGIHDLALQLTGAGGNTLLAEDHVPVWVSSAGLALGPAVLDAAGLEIRGRVELPSGASLPHGGPAAAVFEPNGEALQAFALQLVAGPRIGGYPSYGFLRAGGIPAGSLQFDKALGAWSLSLALLGAELPDPLDAGFGEPARFLLYLDGPAWAGALAIDRDGDSLLDGTDNCPFYATDVTADADRDGRGDACECSDQNLDGQNTVSDLLAINRAIFNPGLATPLCDGNNDGRCNVRDIVAANVEIFSPGSTSICERQPLPGP
jgi:hypothetical protein